MAAVLDFSHAPEPRRPVDHLSVLHGQFSASLKRFFRSYRLSPADVEDLTQDVFMRLAGPSGRIHLRKPEAYLFTLARNLVRDRARRLHIRAAAQSITLDDVDLSCERPTPDRFLELDQEVALVGAALATLKPRAREAFFLHRVHGESYEAIATQMDISVSMVEKHIMAAISTVRAIDFR